jgi:hypothetical protein
MPSPSICAAAAVPRPLTDFEQIVPCRGKKLSWREVPLAGPFVSARALCGHDPRQEPDAVMPHVRIRGRGHQ